MRDVEEPTDRDRARRAAQARAFAGAGPVPANPLDSPRPGDARTSAEGRGPEAGPARVPVGRLPRARRSPTLPAEGGRSGDSRHAGNLSQTSRDLLNPSGAAALLILLLVLVMLMGVGADVRHRGADAVPDRARQAEIIETGDHLSWVYHTLGFTETRSFLMFLGAGVFVILVATSLLKTVTQYAIYRFATMRGYTIGSRLLRGYLYQPYTWFLNRHSADLGANILEDVQKVVGAGLMPAMKLLSQGAMVLFLVVLRHRQSAWPRRCWRCCSAAAMRSSISASASGWRGSGAAPRRQHGAVPDVRRGHRRHQGREGPGARGKLHPPLQPAGHGGSPSPTRSAR